MFAFLNAVLGLNQLNQVVVIATGYSSCDYIYDSSSTSNHGSLKSTRSGLPALFGSLIEKLEDFITKDEELIKGEEVEDRIASSLLSGSLSMALCCILMERIRTLHLITLLSVVFASEKLSRLCSCTT